MVFLVPAHGQNNVTQGKRDPGAIGSGTDEAAVSADLTAGVARCLDAFTDVTLVPSLTLAERITWLMARMGKDDWAFSLHMNAGGASGTEVVYDDMKPQSRDEAIALAAAVSTGLGLHNRGVRDDSQTPRKYLGLVSRPTGRSFIVECAFQDNPSDIAAVRSKGPIAVAEAIRSVMGIPHPAPMPTPVSPEFTAAWDLMKALKVFSASTQHGHAVTTDELAVFLARYNAATKVA
jgi:N-acetylmuramoyl-L-alanine amidase